MVRPDIRIFGSHYLEEDLLLEVLYLVSEKGMAEAEKIAEELQISSQSVERILKETFGDPKLIEFEKDKGKLKSIIESFNPAKLTMDNLRKDSRFRELFGEKHQSRGGVLYSLQKYGLHEFYFERKSILYQKTN